MQCGTLCPATGPQMTGMTSFPVQWGFPKLCMFNTICWVWVLLWCFWYLGLCHHWRYDSSLVTLTMVYHIVHYIHRMKGLLLLSAPNCSLLVLSKEVPVCPLMLLHIYTSIPWYDTCNHAVSDVYRVPLWTCIWVLYNEILFTWRKRNRVEWRSYLSFTMSEMLSPQWSMRKIQILPNHIDIF